MTIDLTTGIVRILDQFGNTTGTGFVLTDDGLIATCAHVVASAGAGPGDTVRLVFHHTGDEANATIEPDGWRESEAEDVAILRLEEALPEGVRPLSLGPAVDTANHPFETFGFPEANSDEGLWGTGRILRQTTLGGVRVLQLQSQEVTAGFSGTPVWDTATQQVVGMVTAITHPDDYGRLGETAFATPTEVLGEVWPMLPIPSSVQRSFINTAPPLPDHFVERPTEFIQLINHLLNEITAKKTVAITTALQGGGGFGKTILAQAICHHPQVQATFPDGILWIELGQTPDLMGLLIKQINLLSREESNITDINLATARLRELVADRLVLLVLDDVWNDTDARPFLPSSGLCAILITTRRQDVATHLKAQPVTVNEMTRSEATNLLTKWLDAPPVDLQPIRDLAQYLGEWPLLLKLAGAYLRELVELDQQPLEQAITSLRQRLERRGFTYLDRTDEGKRDQAISISLGLSLERLDKWRDRFLELAVFPEDTDIPFVTIKKLWGQTANLDELDTEDALRAMQRLSLFTGYDPVNKTIHLHDVIRSYLVEQQKFHLSTLHIQLLDAFRPQFSNSELKTPNSVLSWADLSPSEPYLWEYLPYHLISAQLGNELVDTVKNLRYLLTKTYHLTAYAAELDILIAEQHHPNDFQLHLLRRSFTQSSHLLERCKLSSTSSAPLQDLAATLYSRLYHLDILTTLAQHLMKILTPSYLTPDHPLPDLPHPALLRTFVGHMEVVNNCAYSPDGQRVVSASWDKTLKVWNAHTGQELLTLIGHTDRVNGCAYSPDGKRIVSASIDHTLKVWDSQSGQELFSLLGHTDKVTSCAYSPDGQQIVSTSDDDTIRVWNAQTGQMLFALKKEHTDWGNGCTYSPDGERIVSTFDNRTLKVWDAHTGQELLTLIGHTKRVNGCAYSPDGKRIVSASDDESIKVWDARNGQILLNLTEHTERVWDCAYSPDGQQIATASLDGTLKIWDAYTGQELFTLVGHTNGVNGCAYSPDGQQIVSASFDHTLRVWDIQLGQKHFSLSQLCADRGNGLTCAYSPDGEQIVSDSSGFTLKVWSSQTGQKLLTLTGHTKWVTGCAYSPNRRQIVSSSYDHTLKVWDALTGKELITLAGHTDVVSCCSYSPDGQKIVSASRDHTLKVWDALTGKELITLTGHTDVVSCCSYSPDGQKIVSASLDRILKVWQAQTGKCLTILALDGALHHCAWSPTGKQVVVRGSAGIYFLRFIG